MMQPNTMTDTYEEKNSPLWTPCADRIADANVTRYMKWLHAQDIIDVGQDWDTLYAWSVRQKEDFWESIWDYCGVVGDKGARPFHITEGPFFKRRFFPNAQLNYAENIFAQLQKLEDDEPIIIFCAEDRVRKVLNVRELRANVARMQSYLRDHCGVAPGDRVIGYLPNSTEAIIGFLATVSLGAIWSSCSPDFGVTGVVDRFSQINPKVLLTIDGYFFKGSKYALRHKLAEVIASLPTLEHVIVGNLIEDPMDFAPLPPGPHYENFDTVMNQPALGTTLTCTRLPFDHPMVILYSSGTTGKPKCIVHGHGGTLLQHLKEHQLHCDIKPASRVFYYTTTGWMMWNWLVGSLASRACIVLYDGAAFAPHALTLFDLADDERISFFGVSAKYIDALSKQDRKPKITHDLTHLRAIGSTGSPLVHQSFRYVYENIKKDVNLASLSGGTDIISCFALGCPIKSVYAGQLQTRGLGLAVDVVDDDGNSLLGEKGELVCRTPFPCMPVKFWNDSQTQDKYQQAYFTRFQDIWTHGDYCALTEEGGLIIYGRSDAVLNPGGVRIGTAEIYRQVEKFQEIQESVVVGQTWEDDTRVVLFVKMRNSQMLSDRLVEALRKHIRANASPRHVPAKIIAVADIPKTQSGKIVELAVAHTINNRAVKNLGALANPEALEHFKDLPELQV